jgi:hypothetical protein
MCDPGREHRRRGSNPKKLRLLDITSSGGIIFSSMTTRDDGLGKPRYYRFELWETGREAPGRAVAVRHGHSGVCVCNRTSAKPLERRLAVHGYVVPAFNEMVCRSLTYRELGQTGQDWYDLVMPST